MIHISSPIRAPMPFRHNHHTLELVTLQNQLTDTPPVRRQRANTTTTRHHKPPQQKGRPTPKATIAIDNRNPRVAVSNIGKVADPTLRSAA